MTAGGVVEQEVRPFFTPKSSLHKLDGGRGLCRPRYSVCFRTVGSVLSGLVKPRLARSRLAGLRWGRG
jgi:hypothetical protein